VDDAVVFHSIIFGPVLHPTNRFFLQHLKGQTYDAGIENVKHKDIGDDPTVTRGMLDGRRVFSGGCHGGSGGGSAIA
jgi:hypothetical protein